MLYFPKHYLKQTNMAFLISLKLVSFLTTSNFFDLVKYRKFDLHFEGLEFLEMVALIFACVCHLVLLPWAVIVRAHSH